MDFDHFGSEASKSGPFFTDPCFWGSRRPPIKNVQKCPRDGILDFGIDGPQNFAKKGGQKVETLAKNTFLVSVGFWNPFFDPLFDPFFQKCPKPSHIHIWNFNPWKRPKKRGSKKPKKPTFLDFFFQNQCPFSYKSRKKPVFQKHHFFTIFGQNHQVLVSKMNHQKVPKMAKNGQKTPFFWPFLTHFWVLPGPLFIKNHCTKWNQKWLKTWTPKNDQKIAKKPTFWPLFYQNHQVLVSKMNHQKVPKMTKIWLKTHFLSTFFDPLNHKWSNALFIPFYHAMTVRYNHTSSILSVLTNTSKKGVTKYGQKPTFCHFFGPSFYPNSLKIPLNLSKKGFTKDGQKHPKMGHFGPLFWGSWSFMPRIDVYISGTWQKGVQKDGQKPTFCHFFGPFFIKIMQYAT